MNIKFEKSYCFKVAEANLEQIHTDVSNLLGVLPNSIYDDLLICIHELIINSIVEMEATNQKEDLITIDLFLTDEEAILCLKDLGRGINISGSKNHDYDLLKESGRGLDIVKMLSDWFCIYSEDNCFSYYIIKKTNI